MNKTQEVLIHIVKEVPVTLHINVTGTSFVV